MLLDEKPVEALTNTDIQNLISEGVCESRRLEYKSDWWGDNDEDKREMLRDIASFANSSGGYIVVGVKTERGHGAGDLECPTELKGILRSNYSERVTRSCRDNLDPICPGIEAAQAELEGDRVVLVIRVPQSLSAPHMITFRGLDQFWQRHGTDKQPMSTREIGEMFLSRRSYEEQLLNLVAQRKLEAAATTNDHPILHLWIAPVIPLEEEIDVKDQNLRDLLETSTQRDPYGYNCQLRSGTPHPSLRGLEAHWSDGFRQFIELYRRGYLAFGTSQFADRSQREPTSPIIVALRVAIYMENFATLATQVYSHLHVEGPLAFGCTLMRVGGHKLLWGNRYNTSESAWLDRDLDLSYRVSYDFASDKTQIIRGFNDLLWNAFHYDGCPYYQTGILVTPPR